MFGTLIESEFRPQRRVGGTVLSVAIHTGIIAAAILAGASVAPARPTPPPVVHVTFVPRAIPPHTPRAPRRAMPLEGPVFPAPAIPRWRVQLPDPSVAIIPSIDVAHSTPITVFDRASSGGLQSVIGDPLGGDGTGDATEPTWTGNELLMHIARRVTPRYPESLRSAGIDGRVLVRFTVDTTGRIDPRSIEVLESTNELFTQAVRAALPGFRFTPSMWRGSRVRAAAEMPFQFVLNR